MSSESSTSSSKAQQETQIVCKNGEVQFNHAAADGKVEKLLRASFIGGCQCFESINRPGSGETITRRKPDYEARCYEELSFQDILDAKNCMKESFERANQQPWRRNIVHLCNADCPWYCHRGLYICCMSGKAHFCSGYIGSSECVELIEGELVCNLTGRLIGADYQTSWSQDHSDVPNTTIKEFLLQEARDTPKHGKPDYLEVKKRRASSMRDKIRAKVAEIKSRPITASGIAMILHKDQYGSSNVDNMISTADQMTLDTQQASMLSISVEESILEATENNNRNSKTITYHRTVQNELKLTKCDRMNMIKSMLKKICFKFSESQINLFTDEVTQLWEKIISTERWRNTTGLYNYKNHTVATLYCMAGGGFSSRGVGLINRMDPHAVNYLLPPIKTLKTLDTFSSAKEGEMFYDDRKKNERELKMFITNWYTQSSHSPSSSSSPSEPSSSCSPMMHSLSLASSSPIVLPFPSPPSTAPVIQNIRTFSLSPVSCPSSSLSLDRPIEVCMKMTPLKRKPDAKWPKTKEEAEARNKLIKLEIENRLQS